jgi:hypothetical protein
MGWFLVGLLVYVWELILGRELWCFSGDFAKKGCFEVVF